MILDINPISPPSCLANINELDAVGRTANKTKIDNIKSSKAKYFPKRKINKGSTRCFAKLEIKSSVLESFISFITSPNPTDKSPIGRAALLSISSVLFKTRGSCIPKKFIPPPITQATINGFVTMDLSNIKSLIYHYRYKEQKL